jgi:hypothetical protein
MEFSFSFSELYTNQFDSCSCKIMANTRRRLCPLPPVGGSQNGSREYKVCCEGRSEGVNCSDEESVMRKGRP